MEHTRVRIATSVDEVQIVHTIVAAFIGDPVARWCWPNAHQYLAHMPAFTLAFGGAAFAHQGAHCTNDYCGAALWLPPGAHPNEEAVGQIIEDSVAAPLRGEVYAVFEQMAKYHPNEPHWYLPLIGVDPAHQRKGHGAALLTYALEQCDRVRCCAYLESTNPRNISLYERHGFRALGEIQVGTSPPMVPMLRTPHCESEQMNSAYAINLAKKE